MMKMMNLDDLFLSTDTNHEEKHIILFV